MGISDGSSTRTQVPDTVTHKLLQVVSDGVKKVAGFNKISSHIKFFRTINGVSKLNA